MIECPKCGGINISKAPHDKILLQNNKTDYGFGIYRIKKYRCLECGHKFKIEKEI